MVVLPGCPEWLSTPGPHAPLPPHARLPRCVCCPASPGLDLFLPPASCGRDPAAAGGGSCFPRCALRLAGSAFPETDAHLPSFHHTQLHQSSQRQRSFTGTHWKGRRAGASRGTGRIPQAESRRWPCRAHCPGDCGPAAASTGWPLLEGHRAGVTRGTAFQTGCSLQHTSRVPPCRSWDCRRSAVCLHRGLSVHPCRRVSPPLPSLG